ncbi:MAG: hypothetical protein JO168_25975 [Solirubrobacterales bacterium]|nr:hypothetical protein [Solirubrobacterales bacterium]
MLTVSSESLAVLSAALAAAGRADWLCYAALAPFVLGLALYGFVISRFDVRQLLVGRGDHWITGGALAISTLAAGRITLAAHRLHELSALTGTLKAVSTTLWALTIAWLPVLLVTESVRLRPAYDVRRWATVFPVGMCSVCSIDVGVAAHVPAITDFGRIWIWPGVAIWLVVFAAMLHHGMELARSEHAPVTVGDSRSRRATPK